MAQTDRKSFNPTKRKYKRRLRLCHGLDRVGIPIGFPIGIPIAFPIGFPIGQPVGLVLYGPIEVILSSIGLSYMSPIGQCAVL